MPIPSFLFENSTTIALPAEERALLHEYDKGVGFKPESRSYVLLPFQTAIQEQTNWCWAAVSFAVARFYQPTTPWSQCQIASQELNLLCCGSAGLRECNVYGYLNSSLARVGHYNGGPSVGEPTLIDIQRTIHNGRPYCLRIAWQGGGAHFVTIYGVDGTGPNAKVYISDPWFGESVWTYSQFPATYQGGGQWTHSYPTQPSIQS